MAKKCEMPGCEHEVYSGERYCVRCLTVTWAGTLADPLPCGHPRSAVVYDREGTAYCADCERIAQRLERVTRGEL